MGLIFLITSVAQSVKLFLASTHFLDLSTKPLTTFPCSSVGRDPTLLNLKMYLIPFAEDTGFNLFPSNVIRLSVARF